VSAVENHEELSRYGAGLIYKMIVRAAAQGKRVNIGLATGNTMIALYWELAAMSNRDKIDLSCLHTYNLDEYLGDDMLAVAHDHPLSYWKYMHDNFFDRLAPERNFHETQIHFPDPSQPELFDRQLQAAGNLDLQLLGLGFNGHIAFNEPQEESEIAPAEFGALPSRVIRLNELTIQTNGKLTAGGCNTMVPRYAVTMGMKTILSAGKILLLTCFPEQQMPLLAMLALARPTPRLPVSYLLGHADCHVVYTRDTIGL